MKTRAGFVQEQIRTETDIKEGRSSEADPSGSVSLFSDDSDEDTPMGVNEGGSGSDTGTGVIVISDGE